MEKMYVLTKKCYYYYLILVKLDIHIFYSIIDHILKMHQGNKFCHFILIDVSIKIFNNEI